MSLLRTSDYDMIAIIGPTASGKTELAARLSLCIDAEIVSGDSRQVYRRMDIGTGKDIEDYVVDGKPIAHHLIDIAEPGTKYNVFDFQHDFLKAYRDIKARGKNVVLCGGSGLYVESVLRGYRLLPVPINQKLRDELEHKSLDELAAILATYKTLHNTTDTDNKKRTIRGIEIEEYYSHLPAEKRYFPTLHSLIIGIAVDKATRWERIHTRLRKRLDMGMIDEVKGLLDSGVSADDLVYYGLEYRFITLYLTGQMQKDEMIERLEIAIRQFSKRQMTWFRGMERRGLKINWIDSNLGLSEKVEAIKRLYYGAQ